MPTDIEQQIANYFEWLDHSSGTTLHKSADDAAIDERDTHVLVGGHDAEVIDTQHTIVTRSRHRLMLVAAAAVVVAAIGLIVVRSRGHDDRFATGQPPVTAASWYVIDPASAYGDVGEGTVVDAGEKRFACRHYDEANQSCSEVVGQQTLSYRLEGDTTVTVTTDTGPQPSIIWQMLQIGGQTAQVAGHSGLVSPDSGVGFEASPGTRVVVQASPPTSTQTLTDIAASLTLVHGDVVAPLVFGDATTRAGEIPFDSIGARYYAGYVDLADSCVGSVGVPWNSAPKCAKVPDDEVTVTVASPSPAGTILIAALPTATTTAEIVLQDSILQSPPVTVPGFAPKLLFVDLDGSIPTHLTARDSTGAVIAETDISSTGGAPLGYLPVDGDSVRNVTYYSTEQPMKSWPAAASSRPYADNAGYGMTLCSGGSWTKFAVLATASGWEHSNQGTLCTFTTLGHAVPDSISSCASMTVGTNYAQCKRLAGTTIGAAAEQPNEPAVDSEPQDAALLPPTPVDLPQIFSEHVSTVLSETDPYTDGTIAVTLSKGFTPRETCFRIDLTDAFSEGCLDTTLLTTGLAYAAFERQTGPIDVVGIVPDDVVSVEIGGQVIPVQRNVWHYEGRSGQDLSFTVRSSDGSVTASVH